MDEHGKARGGKPGDNTGKEVVIGNWYNEGWNVVLRPKDSAVAEKIAAATEQACLNDAIGYNQGNRTTLYKEAVQHDFKLNEIKNLCECDCSSLVSVCVNAARVKVSKDIYTGNMVNALLATGTFEKLTEQKYLSSSDYLQRGDILVHEGSHTAVVLDNGSNYQFKDNSGNSDFFVTVTAFMLNVRADANAKSKIVKTITKNEAVHITKIKDGWGYSKEHNGWVNLNYTKRNSSTPKASLAITTTDVNFRTSPSSDSKKNIISVLRKKSYVFVISEKADGWVYAKAIVDNAIRYGWVFQDYLLTADMNAFEKRCVTDITGLNIRTSATISSLCLGTIPYQKKFYVLNHNAWGLVVYEDILGYSSLSEQYSKKYDRKTYRYNKSNLLYLFFYASYEFLYPAT